MEIKLKQTKYRWWDFIALPFQCDPAATIALGVQKALTGISAVVQVPVIAKLIDLAIASTQGEAAFEEVLPWFFLLVLCVGWRRISFIVGSFFSKRLQVNAGAKMGIAFTDKRSRLHYSHIENADTWNLIKRVCTKVDETVSLMIQRVYNLMVYSIRIFGVLFFVFTQVWWIGLLTLLLCIPLILVSFKGGDKNYKSSKEAAQYDRRHQYLAEVLSNREAANERTLFGYSDHVNEDWYDQFEKARKIRLKANIRLMRSVRGGSVVTTILSAFITVALIFPTADGSITVGMFIALATSMYDLINMVGSEMTKAVTQLAQFGGYFKDLTEFVALSETAGATDAPEKKPIGFRSLEFKNVNFTYPNTDTPILKNANFKMESGIQYAFVGVNGSGKTTITKLITGLYDQYEGEILINEKELRTYTQSELKAIFCGIYQDFAKYYISVAENIAIGNINQMDTEETKAQMDALLKRLGLYDDLSALPEGLKTPLGKIQDNGVDLSGGQWQKLAIARTLINPAPVLILDEPTAALDPISESKLYEQFEEISQDKTSIFISHRLGSTKLANKIFVINDGCVAEAGSHSELMALEGTYAQMYESQRSWYQ
ncbi:ABC transporter ATP-binding protein [Fusibacter sp. 3D3]|uniref:ABC transporter ATP-binding protein n=1 Tax=Fusibacter sp. 3D3 TaxID=1048380 RepID=UPI0008567D50|nr:ABC transporter ATP-binding protein [Fusibacter sp. 3D3]GAU75933.1 ABC transporter ATP-binding protein [Fusibacter sp. 3D3]